MKRRDESRTFYSFFVAVIYLDQLRHATPRLFLTMVVEVQLESHILTSADCNSPNHIYFELPPEPVLKMRLQIVIVCAVVAFAIADLLDSPEFAGIWPNEDLVVSSPVISTS